MENQRCLGVSGDNNFSSPVPLIGVYIMSSTLVCLSFLISDVLHGYRAKKSWLPCRFFSLNALTITLLGVATKVPVDLTTAMPSFQDQLSKLCGTLLICMSMGFFMPSLAEMEGFQLFGNMASLTILVITLIVNISIQMSTGVIFSFFFVEHVISLVLLLLTLVSLWYVTFVKNYIMRITNDIRSKSLETNYGEDERSLAEINGLKHDYEASYRTSPQLALCLFTNYVTYVAMICTLAVGVILAASARMYFIEHLEFCEGESDYKWSMWMVVGAQAFTLLVGTSSIIYRSVFFACRRDKSIRAANYDLKHFILFTKIISNGRIAHYLPLYLSRVGIKEILRAVEELAIYILFVAQVIMGWMDYVVTLSIRSLRKAFARALSQDCKDLATISPHLQKNSRKDVTRWISKCEENCPSNLIKLLSAANPSEEVHPLQGSSNSCLLLVLLVRIAEISIPSELSTPLIHALDEVFEILYFIDERIGSLVDKNHFRRKVAKDVWMSRDFNRHWFQVEIINSLRIGNGTASVCQSDFDKAIGIMVEFTKILDSLPVLKTKKERRIIEKIIEKRSEDSIHSLCDRVNKLFVNILYVFLPQLPSMITEYVSQSPPSEREMRLKIALKFMCKFHQLKSSVNWLSTEVNREPTENTTVAYSTSEASFYNSLSRRKATEENCTGSDIIETELGSNNV